MLAENPIDVMLTATARGVEIVDYDEPGLKTIDGVADVGFALSAWFVDTGGNTIGLLQFKDKGLG